MRSASACIRYVSRIAGVVAIVCFLHGNSRGQVPNNLSGYWDLQVPNGDGTFRETFFLLNQNGPTITGTLFGRGVSGTPIEGTIAAGAVHLATAPATSATSSTPPRSTTYDGSFQDGKLTLETQGSRGRILRGFAVPTTKEIATPSPLP
jgi:alpha-galactosidase